MRSCETKHKSINMGKVLEAEVKSSTNISQCDLCRTQRSVRDFRKTGEITWKATAELETPKMDLGIGCLLSCLLFQDPEIKKSGYCRLCKWSQSPRDLSQCFYLLVSVYTPHLCPFTSSLQIWLWETCSHSQTRKRFWSRNKFLPSEHDSGFSVCVSKYLILLALMNIK